MILINPQWLLLGFLPLTLGLFFFLSKRRPSTKQLTLSLPNVEIKKSARRLKWIFRSFFYLSLFSFLGIAFIMSRPAVLSQWKKQSKRGIDILIALDVSESMDADDFQPNRITVAKQVLTDFVKKRSDDRLGLVLFAGEAVTKVPLTYDYDFLLAQIDDVKLRELKQGTAIGMALATSVGRLRKSSSKTKVVILLTDGDSNVGAINPITASHLAKEEKVKIYTIGIGKKNRVVVPIYSYDALGRKTQLLTKVPSYLNPDLLKEISELTKGKSYMATSPTTLNDILNEIDQLERTELENQTVQNRDEIYLGFALVITALLFIIYFLQETRFRRIPNALPH